MKEKNKKILARILLIAGFVLMIINAIDYFAKLNKVSSAVFVLGLALVIAGCVLHAGSRSKK